MPSIAPIPRSLFSHLHLHPPSSQLPTTALVLLHGFGDTAKSFINLAKSLTLPSTLCVVLRAPNPVPFDLEGYYWGDDILFDQRTGDLDLDAGFEKALPAVEDILKWLCSREDGLEGGQGDEGRGCGFQYSEVMMLGYGQGGMVALGLAQVLARSDQVLGGVISIGGPIPTLKGETERKEKSETPILICGGKAKSLVTKTALEKVRQGFGKVEYVRWEREGDAMPRNREEMTLVMRFLAGNLRGRMRAPEGWTEVGGKAERKETWIG